ncbi:MAG: hypothetical protein J6R30_08255 [Bacteroidales bacterium]|nr:hypothetical protein [Bacteroidales bacterium]
MRLIDADALCEVFKRRQRAALRWKENAILADNEESRIRVDAVLAFLSEVKLTIDNAPTLGGTLFEAGYRSGKGSREKIYGDGYQQGHHDGYEKGYNDAFRPVREGEKNDQV